MSALDDLLKKHRKKIIDREKKTFREMLAAYALIEKELEKSYEKLQKQITEAIERGEEISPSWFLRQNRLKDLLTDVQTQISRFGGKASKIIEREQREAINLSLSQTQETVRSQSTAGDATARFSTKLPNRTVETAVGMMGDGSPLIEYFEAQLAPAVANRIKSEVIKAAALGTNYNTIARRLVDAGGITKHRALSTARTEVNRVRRETTREIYNENSDIIEAWEWAAAKSVRTCVLCLSLDGKIFKLNQPFPAHTNCRCTMLPILKGKERKERNLGKDWFERQSDEVKAEILGKDAAAAYKNGDVALQDFVGWKNDKRFGRSVYRKPLMTVLQSKPMKVGAGGNWRRFDEKFDSTILKQSDLSCVSTVGEMLLKNRGIDVSQDTIRDIIGVPAYVEALAMVLNRFDTNNLDGKLWRGFTTDLDGLNLLVKLKNVGVIMKEPLERLGHAVFLDGKTRSGLFKIKDPFDQTSYKMTEKDFWENWGGQVIARWYPKK